MNLKERIADWISDTITEEEEILLCENLDEAFIGLHHDGTDITRAIYDADKVISILCCGHLTYEEALEFYESELLTDNSLGAPIYINRFPEA